MIPAAFLPVGGLLDAIANFGDGGKAVTGSASLHPVPDRARRFQIGLGNRFRENHKVLPAVGEVPRNQIFKAGFCRESARAAIWSVGGGSGGGFMIGVSEIGTQRSMVRSSSPLVHRFRDVIVHAGLQAFFPVAGKRMGGHGDDGACRRVLPSRSRMAAVAWNPSISGIWQSIRTSG